MNPFKMRRFSGAAYFSERQTDKHSNYDEKKGGEQMCLRIVDKEMDQFEEQVEKIKKKINPLSSREGSASKPTNLQN